MASSPQGPNPAYQDFFADGLRWPPFAETFEGECKKMIGGVVSQELRSQ